MLDFKNKPKHSVVNAFCSKPFNNIKVASDGNLNSCCHQNDNFLGNLFDNSFDELWFSELAEEIRTETLKGQLHTMCDTKECPYQYVDRKFVSHESNANGYPNHLEFDLHGSHCNFGGTKPTPETACIMCPRARPNFHLHLEAFPDRTKELMNHIKCVVPYLTSMHILGLSEPFWKDKIFDVLEWLGYEKYSDRINVWTTSNGSVFDKEKQEKWASLVNTSCITFSTDAATPETFLKIRRQKPAVFRKICENITEWCKCRPLGHGVKIHNNINIFNVHEVPDMVRLCKDIGVDELVLLNTHDSAHPEITYMCVNQQNVRKFKEAEDKAIEVANEVGLPISFTRPLTLDYDPELVQIKLS